MPLLLENEEAWSSVAGKVWAVSNLSFSVLPILGLVNLLRTFVPFSCSDIYTQFSILLRHLSVISAYVCKFRSSAECSCSLHILGLIGGRRAKERSSWCREWTWSSCYLPPIPMRDNLTNCYGRTKPPKAWQHRGTRRLGVRGLSFVSLVVEFWLST